MINTREYYNVKCEYCGEYYNYLHHECGCVATDFLIKEENTMKIGDEVKHVHDGYGIVIGEDEGVYTILLANDEILEMTTHPDVQNIELINPFRRGMKVELSNDNKYWQTAIFDCYFSDHPYPYRDNMSNGWKYCRLPQEKEVKTALEEEIEDLKKRIEKLEGKE